jgi:hypothetical protein
MSQDVRMNETAGMLEARLGLIDRIRRVEYALARDEQVRIAGVLMQGRAHDLGNMVQIVKLSALELARRAPSDAIKELVADMSEAAEKATTILTDMVRSARMQDRQVVGPHVAPIVRAAVDLARPAIASTIELRVEVADDVMSFATGEELEALVLCALLDAQAAVSITLVLRERTLQGKRWLELLRFDDRHVLADGELAHMFEPHSFLHVVAGVAKQAGGEVSLSPGRTGLELAVEMPLAT